MTRSSTRPARGLEAAIEAKQWEAACLYLLIGLAEAASMLPPESLAALVDLLAGEEEGPEGSLRDG